MDQNIGTISTILAMFWRLVMRLAEIVVIYIKDGTISTYELEQDSVTMPTRIPLIMEPGSQSRIQDQTVLPRVEKFSDQ